MIKPTTPYRCLGLTGGLVIALASPSQANPTFGITQPGFSSSSSSSSSYSSTTGSGGTSTATATSPTGTIRSSQTVFVPGAAAIRSDATATSSTTAPNTTSATVTIPTVVITTLPVNPTATTPTPAVVTVINPTVAGVLPGTTVPCTTFINTFTLPMPLQGNNNRPANTSRETSRQGTFTVQGLPSRVFPGLGLRMVSASSN